MKVFVERLVDLRIEHGYKQEYLAKVLNVSPSAYGYYEQGRNEPPLESISKIAELYEVSIDYLLGRIDTPNHIIYYPVSEKLTLNKTELQAVQRMKNLSLLEKIGGNPDTHVDRLNRCWEFIQRELALQKKEQENDCDN
jgi:transcriptional regulator with XRE-family HTH domain